MPPAEPLPPFLDFAIALLIGALVGIEREKALKDRRGIGGIRTFVLFAEAGAVAGWLSVKTGSPWILAATVLAVAALVFAGYSAGVRAEPESPGLTTEVAALAVCLLGAAVTMGHRDVAVPLGVLTSAVLAFKGVIHGTIAKIDEDDLYAGLKLLIASFIVLPLLPDRTIDPWDAVNPYKAWWLVILISATSLLGYVAVRLLGTARGFALTGFFGGLVSSTAVTLTFAKRSREEPDGPSLGGSLAAGVLLAWAVMFVRVVVLVAVVHAPLLGPLWLPMLAMGVACVVFALVSARGGTVPATPSPKVPLKNPFSLIAATKFALLFTVVLLGVRIVQDVAPGEGIYAISALAGLTDVDAISLSMAEMAKRGGEGRTAAIAIVIAALANTFVKAGMTVALGAPSLRNRVLWGTGVLLAAGAAAVFVA